MGIFELTIAFRYLVPRKKSLSTALVSLLSVVVISLVVWLVLVFLSVTAGIEKNWLQKLTALHAPLRLTPTEYYYNSYYYRADAVSATSDYSLKTIGEKAESRHSDPYSAESDAEIPMNWPSPERHSDGRLRDPVKETFALLKDLNVDYQDYEISAALLRLNLNYPSPSQNNATLSQMSYLLSFMDQNPRFASLIVPPSIEDLNAMLSSNESTSLESILANCVISEIRVSSLDPMLIPEKTSLIAFVHPQKSNEAIIPLDRQESIPDGWLKGRLARNGARWFWTNNQDKIIEKPSIRTLSPLTLSVHDLTLARQLSDIQLSVRGTIQQTAIQHKIKWGNAIVSVAEMKIKFDQFPRIAPPWVFEVNGRSHLPQTSAIQSFLLPKSYRDMGVRIGDRGTLNFASAGAASVQDQRIQVEVAGFYDPGLFSMGGRCLIVPKTITRTIHATSQIFSPDGTPTNGISIWGDAEKMDNTKVQIENSLRKTGLLSYWKISTYKDFEFSKELFQQFRSDRTLFLMIAILILIVACCNIISLLVLLVNDKKREIAILQAMGASQFSIAAIFGFCGLIMGALSSIIGTAAAIITLNHLDIVVGFLSTLQGHAAFQPAFFGQSLPNQLSSEALLFVFIATPLLSLLAGLIPALRASRIRPSIALRHE